MADSTVDWSNFGWADTAPTPDTSADPSAGDYLIGDSTNPLDPNFYPGLFGSVGPEQGSTTATADTLYSADTPSINTDVASWADGSYSLTHADGTTSYYDSQGKQLQAVITGTTAHLSDGSVVDLTNGNKFNADGNLPANAPDATPRPGSGSFSMPGGVSPSSGGSIPFKPGSGGSPASAATESSLLAKALGSLGASLTSLFSRPTTPTAQQAAINRATPLGAASVLTGSGVSIFVIGALVVGFLLLRGK